MDVLVSNWEYVAIGILVVDKVVAMSPSKMDDLLWASIKKVLMGVKVMKKKQWQVAKRIFRVDQFHGGINSNSAHRDIDKDELVDAVDVDIDTVGQLNMMESQADHTNNSSLGSLSHAVNPGYGMFHFKTDKEHDGVKGSTNWLAIAESTNYEIDMVSVEDDGSTDE